MCSNGVSIVLWGPQLNMGWFMVFNATFNYFIYIVAVSFIGGGNRCTPRNRRPTKSHLTGFIMYEHTSPERGSNSQLDYHTITTTTAPSLIWGNEKNIKIQSINGMNHFDAQMIQDCTYKDTRVCGVQNYTIYIRINFKIELSVTSNGIVIGKYQTIIVLHVFEPRFRQYTEDPWFPSTPFLPTGGVIKKRIFLLNKGRCHAVFRLGCRMTLSKCASDMQCFSNMSCICFICAVVLTPFQLSW